MRDYTLFIYRYAQRQYLHPSNEVHKTYPLQVIVWQGWLQHEHKDQNNLVRMAQYSRSKAILQIIQIGMVQHLWLTSTNVEMSGNINRTVSYKYFQHHIVLRQRSYCFFLSNRIAEYTPICVLTVADLLIYLFS